MTTWEEIRDEVAEMLADGKPLEDVISKLEKIKNEMAKAELIKTIDEMKKHKPITNEDWFCSLSTEEKVKALLNLHEKVRQRMRTDLGSENSFYKGDYYREWLKEKHE